MTTIIGIQHKDHAILASDGQITHDDRIYRHPKMDKIAKVGEYLISGAGDVAACDIAMNLWKPPKPTIRDKENLYQFVISKVVPSLKKCFADNSYAGGAKKVPNWRLLIALNGEIFQINSDFCVLVRDDGYYGMGSGSPFALGALYAGATAIKALEIATTNDINTSAPFSIVEQRGQVK